VSIPNPPPFNNDKSFIFQQLNKNSNQHLQREKKEIIFVVVINYAYRRSKAVAISFVVSRLRNCAATHSGESTVPQEMHTHSSANVTSPPQYLHFASMCVSFCFCLMI
jgi:hypothetical protein